MARAATSYDHSFSAAFGKARASFRAPLTDDALSQLCDELVELDASHLKLLASNSARVARIEVVRELIQRSEAHRFSQPVRMLAVARIAAQVAEALAPPLVPATLAQDLRAEAWATVANSLRVTGDVREAERAWLRVEDFAARGSADPLVIAKLARLRGSLFQRQRRHAEARASFSVALDLYQKIDETQLAARTALLLGISCHESGDIDGAACYAYRGGEGLDRRREPDLAVGALKNLVFYLHQAGKNEDAELLLSTIREVVLAQGQEIEILRLRWLGAKLAAAAGRRTKARAELEAVRRGFIAKSMPYDAALVALELALLHAESGTAAEVERLATEMYPIFVSTDLPNEASAALLLFVKAVDERRATPPVIAGLLQELESLRA